MATPTYKPLATITLSSIASQVIFSNISQSFRDLVLVSSNITNDSFHQYRLQFNSDTGSNYSDVFMTGNGSTTTSGSNSGVIELTFYNAGEGTTPAAIVTQIMDYSATDKHKTALTRASAPARAVGAYAGRWANTAAITSIRVFTPVGSFTVGSTFSLYGIAA